SDELGQPVRNRTAKEQDPFDEIVTLPSHMQHSSKERHSNTEAPMDDCPYEHQLRVDECAEPILLFLHDVNAIYFENSSLLSDKDTQAKVSKGCELMHEYQICTQGASQACNPDEGVQAWRQEAPTFANDEDEQAVTAPAARRINSDAVVTTSTTTRRTIGPDAKTECEALEAFNANLDCAIVTMNDHCEVDAQNT
ncbi:hypothetical protein TELCIR_19572, partial [Teladorsagia circumcincta]